MGMLEGLDSLSQHVLNPSTDLIFVPGLTGVPGNEKADQTAETAVMKEGRQWEEQTSLML